MPHFKASKMAFVHHHVGSYCASEVWLALLTMVGVAPHRHGWSHPHSIIKAFFVNLVKDLLKPFLYSNSSAWHVLVIRNVFVKVINHKAPVYLQSEYSSLVTLNNWIDATNRQWEKHVGKNAVWHGRTEVAFTLFLTSLDLLLDVTGQALLALHAKSIPLAKLYGCSAHIKNHILSL